MSAWSKIDDLRDRVTAHNLVEINRAEGPTPQAAVEALRKKGWSPERVVVLGWEILLSRRKEDGVVIWHFSAKLHPHGRTATEHDWQVLGKIAARIGAPSDPAVVPEDARDAHHWAWNE